MSEYEDLYKDAKFKPNKIEDLDKPWIDMWANNTLVSNTNIMESMLNKQTNRIDVDPSQAVDPLVDPSQAIDPLSVDPSQAVNTNPNIIEGLSDQATYNVLNNQNKALQSSITNMNELYSTDDRKSFYQSAQIDNINTINTVLYYIYFALLIVIAFILILKMPTLSIYLRGAIIVAFIAYPFIISYIELYIAILFNYIYSILNGNVYTNGSW